MLFFAQTSQNEEKTHWISRIFWDMPNFHILLQEIAHCKLWLTIPLFGLPSAYQHRAKKVTIHRVTTILASSRNVLFPGHNHLLTTGADDPTLIIARAPASEGSSVPVVSR